MRDVPRCQRLGAARRCTLLRMLLPHSRTRTQLASMLALLACACGPRSTPAHPEEANAVTELFVSAADGQPLAGASFGWFAKVDGRVEEAHARCCTDDRGRTVLRSSELPSAGEVWVYAVEVPAGARYARASLGARRPGQLQLVAKESLTWLRVHATDGGGDSLEGIVKVTPADGASVSDLDQVLLRVQPPHTGGDGRFAIRLQSAGPYNLQLATWDHADSSAEHVYYRDVGAKRVALADGAEHVLEIPAERVVACSMVDGAGNLKAMSQVGLAMYPHGSSGHNDGCDFVGGEPDAMGARPPLHAQTVRFLWPNGSGRIVVFARAQDNADESYFIGMTELENATASCRIEAKADSGHER